jgi:hypothetical protein
MREERHESRSSGYGESSYESRTERYDNRQESSWGGSGEGRDERRDEGSGGDFLSGMISSVGQAMGDRFNNEDENRDRREYGERREW